MSQATETPSTDRATHASGAGASPIPAVATGDTAPPIGQLLRDWRQRRRLSQLTLSLEAEVSQRHLSCVESGRARPSRDLVLRLAEELDVPLRERNGLLLAAGFAPGYPQHDLAAPELAPARAAIEALLSAQMPHPVLVVDRYWTLLMANDAATGLLGGGAGGGGSGVGGAGGPLNVLRFSLSPAGIAGRILNFAEWRAHVLARLARDVETSADPRLAALLDELRTLPLPEQARHQPPHRLDARTVAVPLRLASAAGPLAFLSTTTVFGTAVDVMLSELTIEAFYPADAHTAAVLRGQISVSN